jgi:hypothetical protein
MKKIKEDPVESKKKKLKLTKKALDGKLNEFM